MKWFFYINRFWSKQGFVPVYLRQTANDVTGEHSCIMLKNLLHSREESIFTTQESRVDWLKDYYNGNIVECHYSCVNTFTFHYNCILFHLILISLQILNVDSYLCCRTSLQNSNQLLLCKSFIESQRGQPSLEFQKLESLPSLNWICIFHRTISSDWLCTPETWLTTIWLWTF